MTTPVVLTLACAGLVGGLVAAEWRQSASGRYLAKPLASAAFIAVALTAGAATTGYGQLVIVALLLGAIGDIALMFEADRWFMAGLIAFFLGHVAYVIAFAHITPMAAWMTPFAIAPALIAALVLRALWSRLGSMRIPVIAYVIVIVIMVAGAVAGPPDATDEGSRRLLRSLGATLFFASDIAVARNKFGTRGFANRAIGLPAYYAGQLLLAWSTCA